MNLDCSRIFNVFPEPILVVTMGGQVLSANKAAYRLFPLLSELDCPFLGDIISTNTQSLEKWLRIWVRSTSMVQGSLQLQQEDGTNQKIALEAAGVHQGVENPVVVLRLYPDSAMIQKFVSLSEKVHSLHQEIAKHKVIESQLRLRYRQLMSKNQHLESLAFYDSLTGLANRRLFDEALQDYWQEAKQRSEALAIILLDIDHFKDYNDTYGHPQGDICLKAVAKAIGTQIREERDIAARFGGEEFVILLRKSEESAAILVIKRIFEAVRQLAIPHTRSTASPIVTLSGGISIMTAENPIDNPEILLEKADTALYQAKKQGRNRFIVGTSPETPLELIPNPI